MSTYSPPQRKVIATQTKPAPTPVAECPRCGVIIPESAEIEYDSGIAGLRCRSCGHLASLLEVCDG